MKIPWKLTKLLVAVFGEDRVKNRRVFTPDFSDSLFSGFSPEAANGVCPENSVVDYFLTRKAPRFFVECDEVLGLADIIHREHPDWERSILSAADGIRKKALPIYHLAAPPLDVSFPWMQLKRGPYDDQLFVSRPQRFGFAPVLAQAALFDISFLESLNDILLGWQEYAKKTPYRWPYNSNHAVVYRVIALSWSWQLIAGIHVHNPSKITHAVLYNILAILQNDVLYLGPNLGESHPNNHLLADYFVGWLVNHMFPELIPASLDFSGYEEQWQEELKRQFYRDGGSFEHAVHYHEHGCELLLIYRLLVEADQLPVGMDEHIGRILRFQARLYGPDCRPWALGDTTEDTLLPLDATFGWSSEAILAVHNHVYPKQALPYPVSGPDLKAFWLLSGCKPPGQESPAQDACIEDYPCSGVVYWRNPDHDSELVFRTGVPPDSDFIPGHMHADILSLYWRSSGVDLLAASGTYTYRFLDEKVGNYRAYFCGPFSHTTVVIDNEDPLGKLNQGFRMDDNGLRVSHKVFGMPDLASFCLAEVHSDNSYNGVKRGVLRLPNGDALVVDRFTESQGALRKNTGWQFDQSLDVTDREGTLEISRDGSIFARILAMQKADVTLHTGQASPLLGWQSRSYGLKTPACYASYEFPAPTRLAAYLLTAQKETIDYELVSSNDGDSVLVNLGHADRNDSVFVNLGAAAHAWGVDEISLQGMAAVHSQFDDGSERIIAIGCTSLQTSEPQETDAFPARDFVLEKRSGSSRWALCESLT